MAKAASTKQKVTFSFVAPDAQSVQVAGDFTAWNSGPVALKKQKDGVWKKVVSLEPGRYEYRYLVDGQWQDDPNCPTRVPNTFGSENCVCVVTAPPAAPAAL